MFNMAEQRLNDQRNQIVKRKWLCDVDLADIENLNDFAMSKKGVTKTTSASLELTDKIEKDTREKRKKQCKIQEYMS